MSIFNAQTFGAGTFAAKLFVRSGGVTPQPPEITQTPVPFGAGRERGAAEYEIHRHRPSVPKWYVRKLDRIKKPKTRAKDQPPKWVREFVEETEVDWSIHLAALDLILSRIDANLRDATERWLRRRIAEETDDEDAVIMLLLN